MITINNHTPHAVNAIKQVKTSKPSEATYNFSFTSACRDKLLGINATDTYVATIGSYANETTTSDTSSNMLYKNVIDLSIQSPY